MNYKEICTKVCETAKQAGKFIRDERAVFSQDKIEKKGKTDLVSYVDKTAEQLIVKQLREISPDAGFITEEGAVKQEIKEHVWIVDPLDGTTNFTRNIAPFAVSIALMHKDEIVVGVIYEICRNELFYTWQNADSYMNGKKIQVSDNSNFEESIFITGFPYSDFSNTEGSLQILNKLVKNSLGIRRLGSAATDLAYVAAGRAECFYEDTLNPWDVAAGVLLVKNAGGMVCDYSGGNDFLFGKSIIATNTKIHNNFLDLSKNYLKHVSC
ncbi:MAG: inositol monophosphatase family protein [Bacteroidales bacterium]